MVSTLARDRDSGGWAEDISDPEIIKGIRLLPKLRNFRGDGRSVTTGVTKKLIEQGYIGPNDTTVVCITGNGLKTIDAVSQEYALTPAIAPRLAEFESFINDRMPQSQENEVCGSDLQVRQSAL